MVRSTRRRRFATRAIAFVGTVGLVLSMGGAAFAAVPLTTVSTDPYTNNTSYHQTEVEPDTFSFASTTVAVFQVGRFDNGGANNIGFATTTNNGASWTNGFLPSTTVWATPPGPWDRISDPSVAYDPEHDVWMITGLAITGITGKAVLVSRSLDGGLTWQAPVTVALGGGGVFYDKEWITCDTWAASPNFGNCYVEWDDAFAGNKLFLSRSTDGGATWSSSSVSSTGVIGGQPVAQPNGTVVVPIDRAGMQSFVSTDGGASYSGPFTISSIQTHFVAGGLRDGGGLPSAEVDASGTVYVVWQDCRFRSGCSANDIVMSTSTDGQVWTAVVRIPLDLTTSTFDHFIPGIGVDHTTSGATAHLGLTYYTYPQASCSTSTCKLAAAFASSTDGGTTWSAPRKILGPLRLSWLPSTTSGIMVGDYVSTSFGSNGKAYPVIANATTTTQCTTATVGSCHEFMVAPTNGLALGPGINAVNPAERPVTTRSDLTAHPATAF
jgi:hypothetical protein